MTPPVIYGSEAAALARARVLRETQGVWSGVRHGWRDGREAWWLDYDPGPPPPSWQWMY